MVVVLTTPLQSAAEEYLFRGYLSQSIAGWVRAPRTGAMVAGVGHGGAVLRWRTAPGPADVPRPVRFRAGASAVVWLTGGLEAAIVLHAVNNVLVFVLAGALGDGVATEEVPQRAGLLYLLVSVASVAAYVAVVARSRHRLRPETPHRGGGSADAGAARAGLRRLTRRARGGCDPARIRQVSSFPAPRGATHGVWGNWQPDGFWFR